jgi:hypothetical protein
MDLFAGLPAAKAGGGGAPPAAAFSAAKAAMVPAAMLRKRPAQGQPEGAKVSRGG